MTLSPQAWHNRFTNQARWTQFVRNHLYQLAKVEQAERILEVGCGSGAVLHELLQLTSANIFGLDINNGFLEVAMRNYQGIRLICGDANILPLATGSFDLTFCHFFLLWVANPSHIIKEMLRVTRPGGYICALAEPDYGGRIDFPDEIKNLGQIQTQALYAQGANPEIGRQIRSMLTHAGLVNVVTGVLGGQWTLPFNEREWDSEWEVLESDLADNADFKLSKQERKAQDREAWAEGTRILFVPTFYGWGIKPS